MAGSALHLQMSPSCQVPAVLIPAISVLAFTYSDTESGVYTKATKDSVQTSFMTGKNIQYASYLQISGCIRGGVRGWQHIAPGSIRARVIPIEKRVLRLNS